MSTWYLHHRHAQVSRSIRKGLGTWRRWTNSHEHGYSSTGSRTLFWQNKRPLASIRLLLFIRPPAARPQQLIQTRQMQTRYHKHDKVILSRRNRFHHQQLHPRHASEIQAESEGSSIADSGLRYKHQHTCCWSSCALLRSCSPPNTDLSCRSHCC